MSLFLVFIIKSSYAPKIMIIIFKNNNHRILPANAFPTLKFKKRRCNVGFSKRKYLNRSTHIVKEWTHCNDIRTQTKLVKKSNYLVFIYPWSSTGCISGLRSTTGGKSAFFRILCELKLGRVDEVLLIWQPPIGYRTPVSGSTSTFVSFTELYAVAILYFLKDKKYLNYDCDKSKAFSIMLQYC